MRLGRFADAMAQRGHSVIILSACLPNCPVSTDEIENKLAGIHSKNWESPLIIPVTPKAYWPTQAVRQRLVPSIVRRGLTAWSFLRHGGAFPDWTKAAKPIARKIAKRFNPDLVWATFGNTSNLWLGRYIASQSNCPWIMDVKDNWEAYVPTGLRRLMARRLKSTAGITYNSQNQRTVARQWIKKEREALVYSGVSDAFFSSPQLARSQPEKHCIFLVGAVRYRDRLVEFVTALGTWLETLSEENRRAIQLRYAGSDSDLVAQVLGAHSLSCDVVIDQQLPVDRFAELCADARLVCYLWAPYTFHHKLLELLVASRAVLAYPGEHEESIQLASTVDTPLEVCASTEALRQTFSKHWAQRTGPAAERPPPNWRWDNFADDLESFFKIVVTEEK